MCLKFHNKNKMACGRSRELEGWWIEIKTVSLLKISATYPNQDMDMQQDTTQFL